MPSQHINPRQFLHSCLLHALRWSFTLLVLAALAYAGFIAVRFHHLDTKLYAWFQSLDTSPEQGTDAPGLALAQYRMDIKAMPIAGIDRNLSGLSFDTDANQLIAVVNRPARLYRLSLEGKVLSRHRLQHASDVEGVAYLGGNRVAIIEEGKSRIVLTELPAQADADIDVHQGFALQLTLESPEPAGMRSGNQGFEGVGYDAQRDHLYVAKEHSPRALYRITGLARKGAPQPQAASISIENLSHWVQHPAVGTDLSSVEVNSANGHLLLLSDESQSLVELDTAGRLVSRFDLSYWQGHDTAVPQAEGITIAPDGTIFIVSEPNLFYRLQPPARRGS